MFIQCFFCFYCLSTMLKVGDAEVNKTSWVFSRSWHFSQWLSWWHLWSAQGNKEASGIHCFIVWEYGTQLCSFYVHNSVMFITQLWTLYVPDLSQKFWVENILFLASFKRGLKNTCMCLESVTTIASDKMGTKTKPLITKWKLISRPKNFFKKHITHSCMWNCTFVNLEHIGSCWTLNLVIKWNCSFLPDNSGYAHKDLRSRHLNIPVIIVKNLLYIRSGDKNESLNVNSILTDSLKNNKNLKCYLNNGRSTLFSKFTPSISFSYKNYISEIALA